MITKPRHTITPATGIRFNFRELWNYRELTYFFAWRDIKVKYQQAFLGFLWAIIQPVVLMLVFWLLFSKSLHVKQVSSLPYPLHVLSGLVLWILFSGIVTQCGEALHQYSNLIRKIYFPRLLLPASIVLANLFDFSFALLILICVAFYFHSISWSALLVFPPAIVQLIILAFGCGTFLSAFTLRYRDFKYVVPFIMQLLFFGTAIIYPANTLPPAIASILEFNPLNGIVYQFRAGFTNEGLHNNVSSVAFGWVFTLVIAFAGVHYFKRSEVKFADLV